jgi:hypothetical protein
MQKENSIYTIYKCRQEDCSYRVQKLKNLDSLKNPNGTDRKISYLFREPKFDIRSLKVSSLKEPVVGLGKIHSPRSLVGLVLSLYVEMGLSSRETSFFLKAFSRDRALPSDNAQLDHLFFFSPLSPLR